MWFDSHCHLQIVEEETALGSVLERAREAGVDDLVTVGIDVPSSRRVLDIALSHELHAAVGIHPNSAGEFSKAAMDEIASLAQDPHVVGIGESGLDFYRDHAAPEAQAVAFEAHIDLAVASGKTLIIHTRSSMDAALETLERHDVVPRTIFHCWSGDVNQLRRALELGAYVSFAGNVSFKSAEDLREAARAVPMDRLLIETDSPYLAPVPHRGKPNEPALVADVGAAAAAARGNSVDEVAQATTANARAIFGLDP
ncbi:MAG: TatD family hydrolase [Actinomycetota bacterium]